MSGATRLSRGRILRNSQRNFQSTGFIGGSVEDASTELELATRQTDGERELQRGSEEPVVLRSSDRDLESLAAGGNALAVEIESAKVEFDGCGACAVRRFCKGDLCGIKGEEHSVGSAFGVRRRGAGDGNFGGLRGG